MPVQFSDHATRELNFAQIDVFELIDMLNHQIKCPKFKKFSKSDEEICSKKNRKIYRIILGIDDCIDSSTKCYVVKHVKPV